MVCEKKQRRWLEQVGLASPHEALRAEQSVEAEDEAEARHREEDEVQQRRYFFSQVDGWMAWHGREHWLGVGG